MYRSTRRAVGLDTLLFTFVALATLASCSESGSQESAADADSFVISVYEDGFYKISLDSLEGAGADLSGLGERESDMRRPRLTQGGNAIPTLLTDESLIFYGQAPNDRYAPYRPYLLEIKESGPAMQSRQRTPDGSRLLFTVPYSQHFEENNFYDGRTYEGLPTDPAQRDPWFWETIQVADQVTIEFELPSDPQNGAQIALKVIGVSSNDDVDLDHDLDLVINDAFLDTVRWDGESAAILTAEIPADVLRIGPNTMILDNSTAGAAPLDIARLDSFTITYQAASDALNGRLETKGAAGLVMLTGFDGQPWLFDISQPEAPLLLAGTLNEDGSVAVAVDEQTSLYAVDANGLITSNELLALSQRELTKSENQADLIVIAPQMFIEALEPLAAHRESQGITVKLVSLEQIYEEFVGSGVGPAAINSFLAYAHTDWSAPTPAYLLLVGDASYDYRDYLGQEPPEMLPVPMVPVTYSGETVSDARLADVDGDGRPDMAVGRWPVREVDDVELLVRRTLDSEVADVSDKAIFAADGSESRFSELNEIISQQSGLGNDQSTHLNGPTSTEFNQTWNEGAWLVTYTGHGSLDRWGKQSLMDNDSVSSLTSSTAPPIVLQLTCLTGLFAHPTTDSLSEKLLLHRDGPISIVAATSLSLSEHQQPFGVAFLRALNDPKVVRVGDAFQAAKSQLDIESVDALREISDTYTLFGDPTALIRRPE